MIKIHTLKNLQQRDVFEFMRGDYKHEHWHESSIFLTEEAFAFLHLHIYEVLPNFNYFVLLLFLHFNSYFIIEKTSIICPTPKLKKPMQHPYLPVSLY